MEMSRGYFEKDPGMSEGELSPEETSEKVKELLKQIEAESKRFTEEQRGQIEVMAELARKKMREQGISAETLRNYFETLEKTSYEAFTINEVDDLELFLEDLLSLEIDPTFKSFYQSVIQHMRVVGEEKVKAEKKLLLED